MLVRVLQDRVRRSVAIKNVAPMAVESFVVNVVQTRCVTRPPVVAKRYAYRRVRELSVVTMAAAVYAVHVVLDRVVLAVNALLVVSRSATAQSAVMMAAGVAVVPAGRRVYAMTLGNVFWRRVLLFHARLGLF